MNIFELCYIDYESFGSWLYYHSDKSHTDFEEDCQNICKANAHELVKKNQFIGTPDLCECIDEHLSTLGYEKVNSKKHFVPCSTIISAGEKHMLNYVGQRLYDTLVKHNQYIENSLFSDNDE